MTTITNETMTVDQALKIMHGLPAPEAEYVLVMPSRWAGDADVRQDSEAIDIARQVVTSAVAAECSTDTDGIDEWISEGDYSEDYDGNANARISEIAAEWDALSA